MARVSVNIRSMSVNKSWIWKISLIVSRTRIPGNTSSVLIVGRK